MTEWFQTNALALFAAVVGLYGAILATVTHFASRRDKRRVIAARLSFGYLAFGPRLSDTHLLLHAANSGHVSVTIRYAGIDLPDKSSCVVSTGENRIPFELAPGAGSSFWIDAAAVAGAARDRGFRGRVPLRAVFRDATEVEHRSKKFVIDIDSFQSLT